MRSRFPSAGIRDPLRALVVAHALFLGGGPALAGTLPNGEGTRVPTAGGSGPQPVDATADCRRIAVRYAPPFAFTWSPQSVSVTSPWRIGPRSAPVTARLRYQLMGHFPPGDAIESEPVEVPAGDTWTPVRLRVSGLLPGETYSLQLVVAESQGACVFGDPGGGFSGATMPTNRWSRQDVPFGTWRFAGALSDFDGDGGADFVTVPLASTASMFGVGIASQGPEPSTNDVIRVNARPGHFRRMLFVLDFSGDGRPDLLFGETTLESPARTSLVGRRNEGPGIFRVLPETPIPEPKGFWSVLDVDGDGKEDVLEIGRTNDGTGVPVSRWYRSLGDGAFDPRVATGLPAPMTYPEGATWTGDVDGDGRPDLLLSGVPPPGSPSRVFRNNGDGSFRPIPGPFESWPVLSAGWADFDGDGHAELALCGEPSPGSAVFRVYRWTAEAGFTEWGEGWPRDVRAWVGAGDLDADGRTDLVLIGPEGGWWRNLGGGRFTRMPDALGLETSVGVPTRFHRSSVLDQDGDGDLDVFVDVGGKQMLFRNDMLPARPRVRVSRASGPPGGDRLVLQLSGELGQRFRISTSPDLDTWSEEETGVIRTGNLDLSYPVEPGARGRYFRAQPVP